jgi:hypothetical protein
MKPHSSLTEFDLTHEIKLPRHMWLAVEVTFANIGDVSGVHADESWKKVLLDSCVRSFPSFPFVKFFYVTRDTVTFFFDPEWANIYSPYTEKDLISRCLSAIVASVSVQLVSSPLLMADYSIYSASSHKLHCLVASLMASCYDRRIREFAQSLLMSGHKKKLRTTDEYESACKDNGLDFKEDDSVAPTWHKYGFFVLPEFRDGVISYKVNTHVDPSSLGMLIALFTSQGLS